ncbi:hypothetical protein [Tumebacillus lipolyticus]|uniref:VOC domain-containing protein n=1 Tax=Tumebacillus lipolyticus TaxID=1280370 RepID=A0ABW5A1T7_9BACL
MKLVFLHHYVKDLKQALAYYRETHGFEEAWREGEHTAAMKIPGNSEVQLMLEDQDEGVPSGGVFLVDSVDSLRGKAGSVEVCARPDGHPAWPLCDLPR